MARFSGLEIEPYIVLEGRILSNAFASRDFLWSDHGPRAMVRDHGPHGPGTMMPHPVRIFLFAFLHALSP